MILNINQLRAFYIAAKLKSITLAAHELMVTPPAITKQVKQFEENLGIRLMVRDRNSIKLTDVGTRLFERCHRVFERIEEMEDFLEDISGSKVGVLRIGSPQLPAKYIMPYLITRFKKAYPSIKIVLDQGTNAELTESILSHRNELAFIRCGSIDKRLKVKAYGNEEIILIAAPNSKIFSNDEISVNHLSTIPLIMPREGTAIREVVLEYLRRFKVTPIVVLESSNFDLTKELVKQDNGASFLVKWAVQEELKSKTLKSIRILEGSPTIEYGIGYYKRDALSPEAWAFLRLLDKIEVTVPSTAR